MQVKDIITHRLINQGIAEPHFTTPEQAVKHLIAMQAQEYAQAKWAIGLRCTGLHDTDVEKAFNDGRIIRTHMMRPTWHFVCPEDLRWMQQLTAHRVHAVSAFMYRKTELDPKILKRAMDVIIKALQGNFLTRDELKEVLQKIKITGDTHRIAYIMMHAELENIICSGPRKGKQFTYALTDERVPATKSIDKETALAQLATRYFSTRGPATLKDIVWWSGLTMKEAREAIALLPTKFIKEKIDSEEYIFEDKSIKKMTNIQSTFLMPDYDEYGISYKDRSILHAADYIPKKVPNSTNYYHSIVVNGYIAGRWLRVGKNKTDVDIVADMKLNKTAESKLKNSVKRFKDFYE